MVVLDPHFLTIADDGATTKLPKNINMRLGPVGREQEIGEAGHSMTILRAKGYRPGDVW